MPKTFTCTICGKEVTKRKSYAVMDGRACREHEEAQQSKDQGQQEQQARIKKAIEEAKEPKRPFGGERPEPQSFKPRCFICEQSGLRQDEWYLRWFIEQEKYEAIHGKAPNIFDLDEMRQAAGKLAGEPCLFYVKWEGENTKIKLRYRTYQNVETMKSFFGGTAWLLVCGQCVAEKGFVTEFHKRGEEIQMDDLLKHSAVFEVVVRPVFKQMAIQELAREN